MEILIILIEKVKKHVYYTNTVNYKNVFYLKK